jgi:hypothetical protein
VEQNTTIEKKDDTIAMQNEEIARLRAIIEKQTTRAAKSDGPLHEGQQIDYDAEFNGVMECIQQNTDPVTHPTEYHACDDFFEKHGDRTLFGTSPQDMNSNDLRRAKILLAICVQLASDQSLCVCGWPDNTIEAKRKHISNMMLPKKLDALLCDLRQKASCANGQHLLLFQLGRP